MLNALKIGVTGGSGFLGQHLLHLLPDSIQADLLARKNSHFRFMPPSARLVPGDCLSGQGLAELAKDKDVLIHMAFLLFGTGWQDYLQTNIRACQQLLSAILSLSENERPKKIIFVSSLAAAGPVATPPGIDEKAMAAPVSAYGWSKLICENMLTAAFGEKCVILRPSIIYGSGDKGLLPMFRSAANGLGISPGFGRAFPVSAIHARDAAAAILLACEKRAVGIYHLDDGNAYDMTAFCKAMARAQNRRKCFVAQMPLSLMGITAALSDMGAGILKFFNSSRKAPQWNMDKYREARQCGWLANSARIRNELGFRAQLDLDEGMREAVAGYRAEGLL